MRAALVAMLLVLPAAVAYSSGSTSAYASGSTSAYASAAYASGSKAASSAAPSPPAGTTTIEVVKATVTLPGVTAAAFNADTAAGKKVRLAFQTSIASKLKICGKSGSDQCTSD